MDRGAWWAAAHGVTRVRYDRATYHTHMLSVSKAAVSGFLVRISGFIQESVLSRNLICLLSKFPLQLPPEADNNQG